MNWIERHVKLIAAGVWLAVLAAGLAWGWVHGYTIAEVLSALHEFAQTHWWAPLGLIVLYAVRPLTFIPAMWLTIAAGSLFGFTMGVVVAIVGENLSADIAYAIARFFGRAPADGKAVTRLASFRRKLQEKAFPTVVTLRAAYLPFDPVNYGCGFLRVPWWGYFFGTFIGILPPLVTYVSFGASVNFANFVSDLGDFDPMALLDGTQLAISLGLLAASAVIAWFAHHRGLRV